MKRVNFDELDPHDPSPWPNEMKKKLDSQFRGVWIPAEICNMVEDGEILIQEAYLLATIDRFVSARGVGCWASNERLAKHMGGLSKSRIQQMIRRLIGLGVLQRVESSEHERVLITSWSRTSRKRKRGGTE